MKKIMRKSDFEKETGFPHTFIDRAVHSKWRNSFVVTSTDNPRSWVYIDTDKFFKLYEKGCFK